MLKQIEQKDSLQKQSIDAIRAQLQAAKEYDESSENKMTFGNLIKTIAEWISAISSGNFDKLGGLTKGVKLTETESETYKFDMVYDAEKEKPSSDEVRGYLKGRTLTINE